MVAFLIFLKIVIMKKAVRQNGDELPFISQYSDERNHPMNITDKRIDGGKAFDWGRTSEDYARFRDIYPEIFYRKIIDRGLCVSGQKVLDIGTGTGVLPRHMARFGAEWTGTDISPEQIAQAVRLSQQAGWQIAYHAVPTERLDFPAESFDVITACQCFWYFDHAKVMPLLHRFLKPDGRLLILYMAWLPYEDPIAQASEALVLRYNPDWSGAGERLKPIGIPDVVYDYFEMEDHEEYRLDVPFTRQSWHGRMKACRGVGASMTGERLAEWEQEHLSLLSQIIKDEKKVFQVKHYAALALLRKK